MHRKSMIFLKNYFQLYSTLIEAKYFGISYFVQKTKSSVEMVLEIRNPNHIANFVEFLKL